MNQVKGSVKTFKEIVKLTYPLFENIQINVKSDPKSSRDFEAYTDNRQITIKLNRPDEIDDDFEKIIVPMYRDSAKTLYGVPNDISDKELQKSLEFFTFLFVNFHELLHPLECPNSEEDKKKISASLYNGIKEAEPHLSKKEVFFKVNNCKNAVWDIVDNLAYLSKTSGMHNDILEDKISHVFQSNRMNVEGQRLDSLPDGILPIIYLTSARKRTTDVLISLLGAMYATMSYNDGEVREEAMRTFFDDLVSKRLERGAANDKLKEMYMGLISDVDSDRMVGLGIDVRRYVESVERVDNTSNPDYGADQNYLLETITKLFHTPSLRYDSLKGFIKTVSEYVSTFQKMGSFDSNTSGHGESSSSDAQDDMDGDSMSSSLDDLKDTLDGDEFDGLLDELSNTDYDDIRSRVGDPLNNAKKALTLVAADEFYKKNASEIEVHTPRSEAMLREGGLRKKWRHKKTKTLTEMDLELYDLGKILDFQTKTGLPVLTNLENGYYRLNEYELIETRIRGHSTEKTGIDIPDNWVSFTDSSGSMTLMPQYVGSNNDYDTLMRVHYGIEKGMYRVCQEMGKDFNFGVVNFSDFTIYGGMDSFVKIFESRSHDIKKVKLSPQCGNTRLNNSIFSKIEKDLNPGKTVYSLITDGDIHSDLDELYRVIDNLGRKKDTSFLYIDIGTPSSFGGRISSLSNTNKGVQYYNVTNIEDIKDKLQSVLINYD